ncbi:MAG: prepilin-type N-terminal cleavage/methylation domain-containing protein [Actinomycetota bacterium]
MDTTTTTSPEQVVPRRRRRDRGFTLSEVLVAISLTGTAVVAVVAGIQAVISASNTSDEQAKVEAVLVSASDRLRAADYVPCPDVDGDYAHLSAAAAAAVGYDADQVEILDIQFWDASAGGADVNGDTIDADGAWGPTNSFVTPSGCQSDINLTTSRTLQKVTIQVSSPDGSLVRTIEVVKSPIVPDPAGV